MMHTTSAAPNTFGRGVSTTQTILHPLTLLGIPHYRLLYTAPVLLRTPRQRTLLPQNLLGHPHSGQTPQILNIPNAFNPRLGSQTTTGTVKVQAIPRGVFEHVAEHLAVETAVNVQGVLESDGGMAVTG